MLWSQDHVHVCLIKPSIDQCIEVTSELEKEHKSITLKDSSSDSIQFLIPTILRRYTIKILSLQFSLLMCDDILSFSSQLSTNKSLTILSLTHGSMSNDGVITLAKSLQRNETLQYLYLNDNTGITSASAEPLAQLLLTNNTLCCLDLHCTNIDTDGIMLLMNSLMTNNTLEELWLDEKHQETCSSVPYYEDIEDILFFS